jgi:hypothetical protein
MEAKAYERILAGEIEAGMRVARTRTANFYTVKRADRIGVSVWLYYEEHGARDRPRQTASWWREA